MRVAPYVSTDLAHATRRVGRSWGCPALPPGVAREVIDRIKGGTLLFAYYPDAAWLLGRISCTPAARVAGEPCAQREAGVAFDNLVEKALERLARSADARVIFGEPISSGGRTIVPVARVAYGFGAALGPQDDTQRTPAGNQAADLAGHAGGGGAGGVTARPVGVLEVSYLGTRFIDFSAGRRLMGAFLGGVAFGLFLASRKRR